MSTLDELGPLPPITLDLDLFDYVALDSPREPPPLELRARLARRDGGRDTDEDDPERLRLAFVAGRPVDSDDLLVLAYLWRDAPEGVVWGVERWSSPDRRVRPYRLDPAFEPRAAADVHAELQSRGPAALARDVRALLER